MAHSLYWMKPNKCTKQSGEQPDKYPAMIARVMIIIVYPSDLSSNVSSLGYNHSVFYFIVFPLSGILIVFILLIRVNIHYITIRSKIIYV